MSASSLLLKSAERFYKARSVTLAKTRVWWSEFAIVSRALRGLFDPYKPEIYYMRGSGPKWRQKHRLPASEIKAEHIKGKGMCVKE